jgi:hypothetical protein
MNTAEDHPETDVDPDPPPGEQSCAWALTRLVIAVNYLLALYLLRDTSLFIPTLVVGAVLIVGIWYAVSRARADNR